MRMVRVMMVAALTASLSACGGAQEEAFGRSTAGSREAPVELTLRTPERGYIDVGDLRGAPVLLFVFSTYDGISQATIQSLRRFYIRHRDVHVVGIAAQPEPRDLLGPYRDALGVPFSLSYDETSSVARGTSMLGALEAVPTVVILDSRGYVRGRHVGYATLRKLEEMLAEALSERGR